MGGGEINYLADANEYLAFFYVGSTPVVTREESSSRAHSGIWWSLFIYM